ncbi:uncharacterized protein LOC118884062 [Balaenoptera musculus]|uniref:Uncharacterized protein LOC118884062 n=1 Tax=Balaenoptera musculus TaxID=9771 RepID=A0A8B8VQV1_BALMU|nr:uncharacterized protein LOC118884062 [Balaenoptera musculus]
MVLASSWTKRPTEKEYCRTLRYTEEAAERSTPVIPRSPASRHIRVDALRGALPSQGRSSRCATPSVTEDGLGFPLILKSAAFPSLARSPLILRLFPAGSGSHRDTSTILARFIGSHLLGGAGSREDPPNRVHSAALRLRFLHFCLFCVANQHLVSKLRESPGLGACRSLVQEDSLAWREGGGPGQSVAASAGVGFRGGGAPGTPWTRGLRPSPRNCWPIGARGSLPPAPPTAAHAGGARRRGRGQRRL